MIIERKLNRLQGYDYSSAGAYFITINAHDREHIFGVINNGVMKLNEYGIILDRQWKWLFKQYDYIAPDEYVIMPDHFHGILHIVENGNVVGNCATIGNGTVIGNDTSIGNSAVIGNGRDRSLRANKIKPLSELIGAFKTTSSKLIHETGKTDFRWQKSYYDRIIRDEEELNRIRLYIINNPVKSKTYDLDYPDDYV